VEENSLTEPGMNSCPHRRGPGREPGKQYEDTLILLSARRVSKSSTASVVAARVEGPDEPLTSAIRRREAFSAIDREGTGPAHPYQSTVLSLTCIAQGVPVRL